MALFFAHHASHHTVKRVQLRVTGARNLPLANDSDVYVVVVPQRSSKTTGATVRSALGVAKFSDVVDVTVAHDELVRIELFTHNRFARDSRIATVSLLGAALRTCDDWWSMSVAGGAGAGAGVGDGGVAYSLTLTLACQVRLQAVHAGLAARTPVQHQFALRHCTVDQQ
jgi:hypothetical protein